MDNHDPPICATPRLSLLRSIRHYARALSTFVPRRAVCRRSVSQTDFLLGKVMEALKGSSFAKHAPGGGGVGTACMRMSDRTEVARGVGL